MKKIVSIAPARTCLFGDHQDYLKLPVITCAIDRHITLAAVPNSTEIFHIIKHDLNEIEDISITPDFENVKKGNHLMSALKVLKTYGCVPTHGYDISLSGNIPINAGTSSSSAVVISWIRFLLEAFGCNERITSELVAKIAYEAEVIDQGDPGGKMDQYSIGLGNIVYLETDENNNYEVFNKELNGLIVGESGIPKQTVAVLGELKEKTFAAIDRVTEKYPDFELSNIRPANLPKFLNSLPAELQVYFKAAVLNHEITQQARLEFKKDKLDLKAIGKLMNGHHAILKDYLDITVPKIDAMIDAALNAGALGAKIVGSGRGGSIVVMSAPSETEKVIDAIKNAGGKDAYSVNVDPGARIIKQD